MVIITQNPLKTKMKSSLVFSLFGNTDKRVLERIFPFFSYGVLMSQANPLLHIDAGRITRGERTVFRFSLCHRLCGLGLVT